MLDDRLFAWLASPVWHEYEEHTRTYFYVLLKAYVRKHHTQASFSEFWEAVSLAAIDRAQGVDLPKIESTLARYRKKAEVIFEYELESQFLGIPEYLFYPRRRRHDDE